MARFKTTLKCKVVWEKEYCLPPIVKCTAYLLSHVVDIRKIYIMYQQSLAYLVKPLIKHSCFVLLSI